MSARAVRLLTLAVLVAAGITLALPYVAPGAVWVFLTVALGGTALLLAHGTAGGRPLTWIIGASFGLRATLGIALFFASTYRLPVLLPMQLSHGLWSFGADGVTYHEQAVAIREAWQTQIDLPSVIRGDFPVSLLIAALYTVLGDSPLHFVLVNAWLGAIAALLAYMFATRFGDRRSALVAAGLVGFWPSSMIWSTQLLKEPITSALILATLLLLVTAWQRYSAPAPGPRRVTRDVALWAGLAVSVFALSFVRENLGVILTGCVGAILGAALVRSAWRRRWTEAAVGLGITGLVGLAALTGMSLDVVSLLSTRHPEVGYTNRGDALREGGDVEGAIAAYRQALAFDARYARAYLELGLILTEERVDANAAQTAFTRYLELEPDDYVGRQAALLTLAALAPQPDPAARRPRPAAPVAQVQGVDPGVPVPQDSVATPETTVPHPASTQSGNESASTSAGELKPADDLPAAVLEDETTFDARATAEASRAPEQAGETGDGASAAALLRAQGARRRARAERALPAAGVTQAALPAPAAAPEPPTPRPAMVTVGFRNELQTALSWFSLDMIATLRKGQIFAAGGTLIDDVEFDTLPEFLAYLPRALANAYLAPYPWQLLSTRGHTGMMRPIGLFEIALILVLLPAIVIGQGRRMTRFRPEEWLVLAFISAVALAYGLLMPNGGTLFRSRLQFLLPALVLAASALPAFAYRLVGEPTPGDGPRERVG